MSRFHIHGVRGTVPVFGTNYVKYGGQTTCFSLKNEQGILVIDAGSGLQSLVDSMSEEDLQLPVTFLFTHFHVDHILGLPAFPTLYRESGVVQLAGASDAPLAWKDPLLTFMNEPYWPISLEHTPADLSFVDLAHAPGMLNSFGIQITSCPLRHTQPCVAYRIETENLSVVVATDHEPGDDEIDDHLVEFSSDCDYLISDAQYDPEEFHRYRGHGHGHWKEAARFARDARAGQLLLAHHAPLRADSEIDGFVEGARGIFPNTVGAAAGMVLV